MLEDKDQDWRSYTPRVLLFFNASEFIPRLKELEVKENNWEARQYMRLAIRYLTRMKELKAAKGGMKKLLSGFVHK